MVRETGRERNGSEWDREQLQTAPCCRQTAEVVWSGEERDPRTRVRKSEDGSMVFACPGDNIGSILHRSTTTQPDFKGPAAMLPG